MRPRPEDHLSDHLPHRSVLHRHGCLRHRHCLTGCSGTSTRSSAHCVRGAPFSARRFPPFPLRQDPRLPADHPAALCSRRAPVISGGAPSGWTAHPLRRLFRQDTASRRESRAVPHPYRRPILRTPASASLQSGRAQSRFAPRIPPPASLARCLHRSVPVPRRLSEAPGPCARIRRKRKAPPPSVSEGGGVSVCGFFIARACRGSLFPR